ncbi:protein LOW PSII ACCUMULATION 3-like protein [Skeletonema marinoi]|uniref:Protein LOW PSII ACCUMULATION 3-like protein n=1 Tax=Skeletonema marinoi TaxID=267567 RepID=A0AAD8YMY1_9STRA|nr:protein LOW PSII ACCUMULATION 3-like protein [Skeletonema marinoi]
MKIVVAALALATAPLYTSAFAPAPLLKTAGSFATSSSLLQLSSDPLVNANKPTELPDSLSDAAAIAANACHQLYLNGGSMTRCRVDFDTSIGDETYTTLKSSTEFMQQFVSSLSLACVEGVMQEKQRQVMKLMEAKAELRDVQEQMDEATAFAGDDEEGAEESSEQSDVVDKLTQREEELMQIIANQGFNPTTDSWDGSKLRIYFPDEGSAALARRDWKSEVPSCVEFSSCGGVQVADTSKDSVVLFFCPRASEAEFVEQILYETEEKRGDELMLTVMVNPLLVDMGVTGFGMAGRRLRERLIDGLIPAYYLRTLPWGALTRVWPQLFTVWQEDAEESTGYRLIKAMDRLPSNPEVEDIYDIENGEMSAPGEGFGLLNALGDFVNGMTRL